VLRGQATEHRPEIYATHSGDGVKNIYPVRAIRTRSFKCIRNLLPEYAHTTHIDQGGGSGDGWKYFDSWVAAATASPAAAARLQAYHQRPAEELYDLQQDPAEMHNLADQPKHAATRDELRMKLDSWMAAQGDEKTVFETPRPLGTPYPKR
jgi:uncharacterized sulfatase